MDSCYRKDQVWVLNLPNFIVIKHQLFSIWNEVSLVFDGRLLSCIMLYALLKVSVVG